MEIRIYVEGDTKKTGKNSSISLREGFHHFFTELRNKASDHKFKFQIIMCGSKFHTFKDFLMGADSHKDSFVSFLIDSDEEIDENESVKAFIQKQNPEWNLNSIEEEQCHLMVQIMESWFTADQTALAKYYGQGFNTDALSQNPNVEKIPKKDLTASLKNATRNTSKGVYHKTRHGPELLKRIDPKKVREVSAHCKLLFETISEQIS